MAKQRADKDLLLRAYAAISEHEARKAYDRMCSGSLMVANGVVRLKPVGGRAEVADRGHGISTQKPPRWSEDARANRKHADAVVQAFQAFVAMGERKLARRLIQPRVIKGVRQAQTSEFAKVLNAALTASE